MYDRRSYGERRKNTDRRRSLDRREVAIEICRSELRMAKLHRSDGKGPDQVATRAIPWRKNTTSYFSETAVQELTEAFRILVVEEKLSGSPIRIALSGDLCVTRVLTGTVEHVRKELLQLEDRSQLYLSLGPGKKAIAGSIHQLDARHQIALLTVANQKTMDMLAHVADTVGVQFHIVEPSLVALSRMVGRMKQPEGEPQMVVHLDGKTFELGVCHQGQLLLDYRPANRYDSNNVAEIILQHLTRLQRYCDRHYKFLTRPLRHVFICGKAVPTLVTVASFDPYEQLNAEMLNPEEIDSNWKYIGKPPGCDMATVLGAILFMQHNEIEETSPNLMERLIAESRPPLRPFLTKSLLPIAAVLIAALTLFLVNFSRHQEIKAMQSQLQALEPIRGKTMEFRRLLCETENKLQEFKKLAEKLDGIPEDEAVSLIGKCMPEDLWLDRMTIFNNSQVSLAGASYGESGIEEFVGWLDKAPGITQVALGGSRASQTPAGPATKFDIDFVLVNSEDWEKEEIKDD
ncbi:MAG: PilN domain-containing protein [Pirellulales bacterium]|nr:PilN domain-containing protein [Pirellulales bacterium]